MPSAADYVELRCRSAFSFLDGASLPEDLVDRAAALGYDAIALADRNGLYGAPRFFQAAKDAGVRAIVGADVVVEGAGTLHLLVEDRAGYTHLCRLLTAGALGRPKGDGRVTWEQVEEHAAGLFCLAGGDDGGRPGQAELDRGVGARPRRAGCQVPHEPRPLRRPAAFRRVRPLPTGR